MIISGMKPLVTISIPVYNVEKYIERSLLSALNQTYENLEILIVDDKGTDNSMSVVRDIIKDHQKGAIVRIIDHIKNKGTGAARNSAIDNARGEYMFFMDSDDYITDDCIQKLVNYLDQKNYDMVVGSYDQVSVVDGSHSPCLLENVEFKGDSSYYEYYKSKNFYIQIWNKLIKTSILRDGNIRCIPETRNEDVYLSFLLFSHIKSLVCSNHLTYVYSIGDPQATTYGMRNRIVSEQHVNQFIQILNQMIVVLESRGKDTHLYQMGEFFLSVKAGIIKEIVKAKNLNAETKSRYLSNIPSSSISLDESLKNITKSERDFLRKDPFTIARIEHLKEIPSRILKKLYKIKKYIIKMLNYNDMRGGVIKNSSYQIIKQKNYPTNNVIIEFSIIPISQHLECESAH